MSSRVFSGSVAVALLALAVACSSSSTNSPVSPSSIGTINIADIAASASTPDTAGALRSGPAPASAGGPQIEVAGNARVINGGTLAVALTSNAPFDAVYMFVAGRTVGLVGEFAGGIEGHYEIRLGSARTATTVLLTFPQNIPLDEFDLRFAVANPSGAVGPYSGLTTAVTRVGTGDVQVTLSWNTDADVDLHVVGPNSDEVYYGRRQSPSGGELDLDSNAACATDNVRNENITWPTGRAPRGQYVVRVDYWANCGADQTNYTVRVNNGGNVQVVTGSFTGTGDQGSLGSGRTVATFERTTGPSAIVIDALGLLRAPQVTKTLGTSQARER